jgi:aspartate racemase
MRAGNKKAIGILGGMGPEASVYLYKTLIELAVRDFGAKHNDDFPEILLSSVPVPDFISDTKAKQKALEMLKKRVEDLNTTNISCLSIACNTAHMLLTDLQLVSKVPFISMIDEVVAAVAAQKIQAVGLLGTPSTIRSGMYQKALQEKEISCIAAEDDFNKLEEVIRNVIKNQITKKDADKLVSIANSLKKKGAQGIILGCTELPLVFPKRYSLPVFNSVEILAQRLLRIYYK